MKKILETKRLILREYTMDDLDDLYLILSDPITMAHYPHPYNMEHTKKWINWNLDNYKKYGFGLYALILKENGKFIGDCGLTMQPIHGNQLPEIGYHINKDYWRCGYGKEAAEAIKTYIFDNFDFDRLYSYMKYDNVASYSLAKSIGMKKIDEYEDKEDKILLVYSISREEYLKSK